MDDFQSPAPAQMPEPAAEWPPPPAWPTGPLSVLPEQPPVSRRPTWMPFATAGVVLAVLAAVIGFVVLGGGSGSTADAATIVRAASQRAAAVGSSSVSIDMSFSVAGRTLHATGTGAFDYRRRTGSMSLDMAGLGTMQEIVTRRAIYIRMPDALRGASGSDRPWFEMRFSELKSAGIDYSKLMNANPTGDPTSMLRMLSNVTAVHRGGTETVGGVDTTRYSVTASLTDMLRAEGITGAVDLSKLPAGLADTQIHVTLWLDNTGLPRRMQMSMPMPGDGSMTMTMDMFGFGQPVHVVVPPKSIVTDIAHLQ